MQEHGRLVDNADEIPTSYHPEDYPTSYNSSSKRSSLPYDNSYYDFDDEPTNG